MPLSKMGERAYRDAPGLNKSLLVPFMRSPQHYLHELENKKEPTDSMNIGTAVHAELLQPDKAKDIYAVHRKIDRRKNADKDYISEFKADHAGKVLIDEEGAAIVASMVDAVRRHPEANRLIESSTHREQALFADYKSVINDHTIRLKALADGLSQPGGWMFDIKTTENATPSEFAKKVRAFRYDIQQVHYQYCSMVNGVVPGPFYFIVVENSKPHGVAVYTLDGERIKMVWDEWKCSLDYFARCHEKQDFSASYPEVSTELKF